MEKKKLRLCEIFLQKRQIKRDRKWVTKIEKKQGFVEISRRLV